MADDKPQCGVVLCVHAPPGKDRRGKLQEGEGHLLLQATHEPHMDTLEVILRKLNDTPEEKKESVLCAVAPSRGYLSGLAQAFLTATRHKAGVPVEVEPGFAIAWDSDPATEALAKRFWDRHHRAYHGLIAMMIDPRDEPYQRPSGRMISSHDVTFVLGRQQAAMHRLLYVYATRVNRGDYPSIDPGSSFGCMVVLEHGLPLEPAIWNTEAGECVVEEGGAMFYIYRIDPTTNMPHIMEAKRAMRPDRRMDSVSTDVGKK